MARLLPCGGRGVTQPKPWLTDLPRPRCGGRTRFVEDQRGEGPDDVCHVQVHSRLDALRRDYQASLARRQPTHGGDLLQPVPRRHVRDRFGVPVARAWHCGFGSIATIRRAQMCWASSEEGGECISRSRERTRHTGASPSESLARSRRSSFTPTDLACPGGWTIETRAGELRCCWPP